MEIETWVQSRWRPEIIGGGELFESKFMNIRTLKWHDFIDDGKCRLMPNDENQETGRTR